MRRLSVLVFACMAAVACSQSEGETASIQGATAALGADSLTSIQFIGSGQMFSVGQPPTAMEPWPPVELRNYTASVNYQAESMRLDLLRFMGPAMPRGGGAPFTGEQTQVQVVSGDHAWNVTPAGAAQPQPAAVIDRKLGIWTTPHGFLKAAAARNASSRAIEGGTEVTFTVDDRQVVGIINDENEVERVQTWFDNPVMGDMLVETEYSDYRDFNGVRFPAQIRQTQGGHPSFQLTISSVEVNPTVDIAVPENVLNAPPPGPQQATSERLADGVYWITGGSHHSMAVDMGDHVVVIEAPLTEARSEAVIAETKRIIPDKPIRYVVNTHIHFDHSGGLRTYVDEGATIVTHQANQAFYERAWAGRRELNPDRTARSGRTATFQGVTDGSTLEGTNKRTIVLYVVEGNPHNEETLIAWLPNERILFQADMMNPPAEGAEVPPPTPAITSFYENVVERLKLQPRQIVGGHGNRVGTMADLNRVAGRGTS
jgi:glyoxylase-like metal-dependent hydrolase (beta-lactamase superfamily II)